MDFKNKFIRYHPDITFEIFQLIWDKLFELGYKGIGDRSAQSRFNDFKNNTKLALSKLCHNEFNTYSNELEDYTEITIEEFLGYNPFTKSVPTTEIESPEYYEYTEDGGGFTNGKIYKIINPKNLEMPFNFIDDKEGENGWSTNNHKYFKPSTKEAFDLQEQATSTNKPEVIQPNVIDEFKAGDYIVTLKGGFTFTNCGKENYCFKQRIDKNSIEPIKDISGSNTNGNNYMRFDKSEDLLDWRYATIEEIAEYDRLDEPYDVTTLNKPVESFKQSVHCKTQEEWDFVLSKFNPRGLDKGTWHRNYQQDICITYKNEPNGSIGTYGDLDWYKKENYEIISFEDWCKQNNYVMKTKSQFEVGKWYKVIKNNSILYFAKCLKFEDGRMVSQQFYIGKYQDYEKQGFGTYKFERHNWEPVSDLSEIQQYLPDGHPDKVIKSTEFKVGDWVLGPDRVIAKITKIDLHFLYTTNNYHKYASSDGSDTSWIRIEYGRFRLATPEEIQSVQVKQPVESTEFVLPEKWCIKITKENLEFCKQLRKNELGFSYNYCYLIGIYYSPIRTNSGFLGSESLEDRVEITFDQFKQYVLKDISKKEEIMENKIEKWSPGTYVLMLRDDVQCNSFKKFTIKGIRKFDRDVVDYVGGTGNSINRENYEDIKWFATLKEAEIYRDSLQKTDSIQFLLEEAERIYPIGTKFGPVNTSTKKSNKEEPCEIKKDCYIIEKYYDKILIHTKGDGNLYYDGVWAEIVAEPSKSTMETNKFDCPFNEGDLISCYIEGNDVDGKIHFENGIIYICNNECNGNICRDKLGYAYSWMIYNQNSSASFEKQLEQNDVVNLKLLNKSTSSDSLDDEYNEIFNSKGIKKQIKSNPVTYHESFKVNELDRTLNDIKVLITPKKPTIPVIELIKIPKI